MIIIDAICEIPGLNLKGKVENLKNGYKCNKYSMEDEILLSKWSSQVCEKLMARNNLSNKEIGVIVNSSVSLLETTERGNSAAPGLSHSIQKELQATNAYVFEMFQADWPTTLRVANDFLTDMSSKYALIVHADKMSGCEYNEENGFIMPDGVGAMLIRSEGINSNLENSYYHLNSKNLTNSKFHIIENKDIENKKINFQIDWDYNDSVPDLLCKELNKIIEAQHLNGSQDLIVESWFPQHKSAKYDYTLNYDLGKFSIPWHLQDSLKDGNGNYSFISYNPFLSQYSMLKLKQ